MDDCHALDPALDLWRCADPSSGSKLLIITRHLRLSQMGVALHAKLPDEAVAVRILAGAAGFQQFQIGLKQVGTF